MKQSISKTLSRGMITILISFSVLLLTIFVVSNYRLVRSRFATNAAEQLTHISQSIEMFLKGSNSALALLRSHPLAKELPAVETNFLTAAGSDSGAVLVTDSAGWALHDLLTLTRQSHSSYLDVYVGTADGGFIIGNNVVMPTGFDPRVRPWYNVAKKAPGVMAVSPVYVSASSSGGGEPGAIVSVCEAVSTPEGVTGVFGIDVSLDEITHMLEEMKIGEDGAVAMIQGDGTIIANPLDPSVNFVKASADSAAYLFNLMQDAVGSAHKVTLNDKHYLAYRPGVAVPGTTWEMVAFICTDELAKPIVNTATFVIVVTLLLVVVLYLVLTTVLKRVITQPLNEVTRFVQTVAEGNFDLDIQQTNDNEIGEIQKSLREMSESLREKAALTMRIAKGDLTDSGTAASPEDRLGQTLEQMVGSLNGTMNSLHDMIHEVNSSSSHLATTSQNLSNGASQQAASIEQISSSMNEIEAQSKTNASNALQAKELAADSREAAQVGSDQMTALLAAMEEINSASTEIARIMSVIDAIAFQTNLLALNASVEAARAGQQGRGFAVVADEVRTLAQRSAEASASTGELIERAVEKIKSGNDIAKETAESLNTIVEKINESTELVEQIAIASESETIVMKEIAQGIDQVSQVTQESTANAEETASTSRELSSHAGDLEQAISHFELQR